MAEAAAAWPALAAVWLAMAAALTWASAPAPAARCRSSAGHEPRPERVLEWRGQSTGIRQADRAALGGRQKNVRSNVFVEHRAGLSAHDNRTSSRSNARADVRRSS